MTRHGFKLYHYPQIEEAANHKGHGWVPGGDAAPAARASLAQYRRERLGEGASMLAIYLVAWGLIAWSERTKSEARQSSGSDIQ